MMWRQSRTVFFCSPSSIPYSLLLRCRLPQIFLRRNQGRMRHVSDGEPIYSKTFPRWKRLDRARVAMPKSSALIAIRQCKQAPLLSLLFCAGYYFARFARRENCSLKVMTQRGKGRGADARCWVTVMDSGGWGASRRIGRPQKETTFPTRHSLQILILYRCWVAGCSKNFYCPSS